MIIIAAGLSLAFAEEALQGLAGTPAKPGFVLPLDVLVKRAWIGRRAVVTAGGGPSLTYMRHEGENTLFPGVLGSLGGSWWFGDDMAWGILAEVDAGVSFEREGIAPELELATGLVFALKERRAAPMSPDRPRTHPH